ncbi:MAG: trimethylamine methyltransferase family protein [Anaerolineales bacterium]
MDLLEGQNGVRIDHARQIVTFQESAVMAAMEKAPRKFTIYGRDFTRTNAYGESGFICQAIPGETQWVDPIMKTRRPGTVEDFKRSVIVADALENIEIVGAMIQPAEIPTGVCDVYLYAELFKRTRKPVRSWVQSRTSARYVLEILYTIAGGQDELRAHPLVDFGFEPVSPLLLPAEPLEIALDFARAGLPITIGPMPQAMGTGPVTLAGNVALGNAEALATAVVIQTAAPGTPLIYFNGPHIMDPRTMNLVFSSPEQCLMATMVAELGAYYGLPVGVNVGMTDAKIPDAQAGQEKIASLLAGALAGANIVGGMGIAGCDQGFSLPQLIIDDEMIGFVRRMAQGVHLEAEALAYEVIQRVGIGGTFLMDDHTLDHWKSELWIPKLSDRNNWDLWIENGGSTMLERAIARQEQILQEHALEWLEEDIQRELDRIVAAAGEEMVPA